MLTNEEVRRLIDIAGTGLHRGEVALARRILTGVLTDRPRHTPAQIALAVTYLAVGDYGTADQALQAVLKEHPEDADARAYLGLNQFLSGNKDEARTTLAPLAGDTSAASRLAHDVLSLC